jgi:predicted TIM-barrel fold metal-dependent hydrolase
MCKNLEKNVSRYLADNFFITTSGNFRTQALLNTMLEVSSDRILFSTDYPYESAEEAASWFDSCPISQRDRVKIGRENAAKLFGLRTAGGSQPNLRDDETSEPSRTPGGRRGRIPDRVRNNHRPS